MTGPLPSTIAHLDALTATGADGWIVISALRDGQWRSKSYRTDKTTEAAHDAARLDAAAWNIFVRTNFLARPLRNTRERGGAADTGAAVAFAVDLDVAGPGHRNGNGDHPLPETLAEAMTIVAGLPQPTLTINTGGGLHLWWLLDEPITDNPVGLLDEWADGIVEAGRLKGWHVDRPDPARVLRVCGTYRRKPGLPPNLVTMEDVAGWPPEGLATRPWCPTGRYGASELLEALPAPEPTLPAPSPARPRRPGEIGPADAVARRTWGQILEPIGWTLEGTGTVDGTRVELWRRPGATSDFSIKCFPDGPAVAWSDACGLPTGKGQRLNKWRVFVALHHGGDEVGAARMLRRRARELSR